VLLLPQPRTSSASPTISLDPGSTDRLGFDLRSFVAAHGLLVPKGSSLIEDAAKEREVEEGGGIFLWREIWDPSVSMIYNRILRRPEPVYGPPPKLDPYVDEHGNKPKKYFSTPWTTGVPSVAPPGSIPMPSGANTPLGSATATETEVGPVPVPNVHRSPAAASSRKTQLSEGGTSSMSIHI